MPVPATLASGATDERGRGGTKEGESWTRRRQRPARNVATPLPTAEGDREGMRRSAAVR